MSASHSPMSRYMRREGLIEWISRPEYTHAITLAPNRDISTDMLRRMFGAFGYEIDRFMFGSREVERRYSTERIAMIVMPEKLDTNPHLHGVANFSRTHWHDRLDKPWMDELPNIWAKVTRGSGQMHIELNNGRRAAEYMTKEAFRAGHEYFLSQDFHPDRRIRDKRLSESLNLIAPERKAA